MSNHQKMDPRALAGFVSSVISQALLSILLFPSATTTNAFSLSHSPSSASSSATLFSLILHLLSSSHILTSITLLPPSSRKRKRPEHPSGSSSSELEEHDHAEGGSDDDVNVADRDHSMSKPAPLPHPDSFKLYFRMTSDTFKWLSGLLEPLLECRDPVNSPLNLSSDIRLGIGLFRLATGSSYADTARRFGVSEFTSKFCTKQLCRVLCTNFRFWVAFPSPVELNPVSTAFEAIAGLPNCYGVIDCTRFKIIRKDGDNSQEESVAAQIVVDSSSRILSVIAGYRGDKGDSRILKSSSLYKDVEAHHLMRLPALRTIDSLKNWGVLGRPIEDDFKTAVAFIGACSILHNALLIREDYSALSDRNGDYSVHDHSSQYYGDASLEDNLVERRASVIRIALAARAKEVHEYNAAAC
uniref:Nuclease HARBI1 n=1 Tax=Nelumbo nucifera TaxID=4432 RepID=A0A822XVQ2_NELNU|nr:TPA_asm: hypothetical protein HUJ06_022971 [Nelumbo nucifera]